MLIQTLESNGDLRSPSSQLQPIPRYCRHLGNEPANWNAVKLCLKYTNDSSLYVSFTYRHQSFEVYWNSCNKNLKWGFFMRTHRINYFHALESRNGFFFPKQLFSFYLMSSKNCESDHIFLCSFESHFWSTFGSEI